MTLQTDSIEFLAPHRERQDELFTDEAVALLTDLHRRFEPRRQELLRARADRDDWLAAGGVLEFPAETESIRSDPDWRVAGAGPGLADRRVEITGPTDRKMTVNALNSGAKVWLADFEDASTPLWSNVVDGQLNLRDALLGRIDFTAENGRRYEVGDETPTIVVRPRGWHLDEKHLRIDGEPIAGAFVDFALHLVHCAQLQLDAGRGPYFYLPKLENRHEARLWDDVFRAAQDAIGIPVGTIRATVLIETITAAFEMDEILFELRDHAAGLNAGRWDYLFSIVKKFRARGTEMLLPDRNSLTMTAPFMRAYTELLVRTCHRRGAHAIGGMAAVIPNRRDPEANAVALEKVRADKTREAGDGFDGSWVAHPDLVPICRDVFDAVLGDRPNQLGRLREEVDVSAPELLDVSTAPGSRTAEGLRNNVSVSIQYLESWLRGTGAVAIFGLMEDAATAEIARAQVWQWMHNAVSLDDGTVVTTQLVDEVVSEITTGLQAATTGDTTRRWQEAEQVFREVTITSDFVEFITTPAYARLP